MVGVIGAMKIEVETIINLMENKEAKKIGRVTFVKGTLDGKDIVIAECGIGKVAAAICAQTMILEYKPDCIINTGVGGSLSKGLKICDVVLGETLVQHDMDTSPIGDPIGLISGLGIIDIPADKKVNDLLEKATKKAKSSCKVVRGKIASGDQFIADNIKKDFIVSNFGAICCEMEGAAIAQTCYSAKVPFGVVRAISDCADGSSHMDYSDFLPKAAKIASGIIRNFVKEW